MKLIQTQNIDTPSCLIKNQVVYFNNCFCKNTLFIIWVFAQNVEIC